MRAPRSNRCCPGSPTHERRDLHARRLPRARHGPRTSGIAGTPRGRARSARRCALRLACTHRSAAATREQLARVHAAELIDAVLDEPRRLRLAAARSRHGDVAAHPPKRRCAPRARSAPRSTRRSTGTQPRAFCAVRPPGHHATRDTPMGFCLFNNVAVGAAHALAAHGLSRVAIVDFDVHHGNGTQDIFWTDPRVLYASSHQWPLYPGTGARGETRRRQHRQRAAAAGSGLGRVPRRLRRRRAAGDRSLRARARADFGRLRRAPARPARQPESRRRRLRLDHARLVEIADRHAKGRIVSSLEGGYSLTALRESVAAHVAALGA